MFAIGFILFIVGFSAGWIVDKARGPGRSFDICMSSLWIGLFMMVGSLGFALIPWLYRTLP